jgi:ATPase subunit of ABC transporter with duplicated ATPase domains
MKRLLVGKKQLEKEENCHPRKARRRSVPQSRFPTILNRGKRQKDPLLSWTVICGGKLLIPSSDLDLVGPGQNALVGANGIGKSTLLEALYEANKDRKDIRLGYMPQNYEESFLPDGTILSFLLCR